MQNKKVAMITGAASGIGAATARLAVAAGYSVVIADIDLARAEQTAQGIGAKAWALALDITSQAQWAAALDTIHAREGRLDVLVNNAAIVHTGWARDLPPSAHGDTIQTNCIGAMYGMLSALPRFKAQGAGHLITIASMVAFIPYPGLASYAAAKHALRAFHVALAIEESGSPVDFTLVYPGATETPMLEKETGDDAVALAFAGEAMTAEQVAAVIVDAMATRPEEVFLHPDRANRVKSLGVDIQALRSYVAETMAIGREKQQQRRARLTGTI